jgi:hypothetical protein
LPSDVQDGPIPIRDGVGEGAPSDRRPDGHRDSDVAENAAYGRRWAVRREDAEQRASGLIRQRGGSIVGLVHGGQVIPGIERPGKTGRTVSFSDPPRYLAGMDPSLSRDQLLGRTLGSVYARRHVLGLDSGRRRWTAAEDRVVLRRPPRAAKAILPHRTLRAIYDRRDLLRAQLVGAR